ncbi:hypothetical protein TNCV_3669451 [Trichonephila clavipes]|nr:hypothetical protein TNCV_3669451 [Trichonephila clavipes]
MTATAGSDVVQFSRTFSNICGRISAITRRMLSSKWSSVCGLSANSQVQNMKLGGHQTCLSINRLWHELCDMLHRLVGTTAPGHHNCSIQE